MNRYSLRHRMCGVQGLYARVVCVKNPNERGTQHENFHWNKKKTQIKTKTHALGAQNWRWTRWHLMHQYFQSRSALSLKVIFFLSNETSLCDLLDVLRTIYWPCCLLFEGHRYPMINSGDTIALKFGYTYGSFSSYWLSCTTTSCGYSTCPGTMITSSEWTSCSSNMRFFIYAMNKVDGQPINSGDTVSIASISYGSDYRLRCDSSTTYKCRVIS